MIFNDCLCFVLFGLFWFICLLVVFWRERCFRLICWGCDGCHLFFFLLKLRFASILLYGCTTWTLTRRLEKKLDSNYTRKLWAILNKSWRQHPTTHQLYGHLPPITKTIQVRRTRHAGHCWRSRDELISDVLLWTPTHGRAKAGRPARTYIQQLCEDTGCSPEDLPEAMNDREKWRKRVRDIRATSTTWWWWCIRRTVPTIFRITFPFFCVTRHLNFVAEATNKRFAVKLISVTSE